MILLLAINLLAFPAIGQNSPTVLLIYGSEQDRQTVTNVLDEYEILVESVNIDALSTSQIADQDLIIFASSEEFSTDDLIEISLEGYLQESDHAFLLITPYVDEFSGSLETALGIENVESETDNITQSWDITFDTDFPDYDEGAVLEYTGIVGLVELTTAANLIASFTSATGDSEDLEDLELPRPAFWNITTGAATQVMVTGLDDTSGLELDQLPIASFLTSLISLTLDFVTDLVTDLDTGDQTDTITTGTQTTSTQTNDTNPILPALEFNLLYAAALFIMLVIMQVVGVLRWLADRFWGVLIFVAGAFYNISDRTLSHTEVVMHMARSDILGFLTHVGGYGAHLREIKTVTGLGSGSLLWHLQMLEDYGLIHKYKIGKYTVFVSEESHLDPHLKEVELDLQSKYTVEFLEALLGSQQENISISELGEDTGIAQRALRRLVTKLDQYELVEVEKYPQMSVSILQRNLLENLYESFQLRSSYTPEREMPDIERFD